MNDRERRRLAKYVAARAVDLGLRDWEFLFEPTPSDDGTMAQVTPTYGRRLAVVAFCADFHHKTREEQRQTVVHELLHVHFAAEAQAVIDATKQLSPSAAAIALDAYRMGHEYGVDALADAIAPLFPLP